ncbi:GNAT family N-acetyltransferase [Nocardioides panacis]
MVIGFPPDERPRPRLGPGLRSPHPPGSRSGQGPAAVRVTRCPTCDRCATPTWPTSSPSTTATSWKLAPMDEARLHEVRESADRFDVLDVDGAFAGFVITFAPGAAYDSVNYRWFAARHERFYYLDRIVLHEGFRRRGLGGQVYDEIERIAAPYTRLALEVNLVPRNDASLAFHAARGYREVGRLGDDEHLVAMLEKPL